MSAVFSPSSAAGNRPDFLFGQLFVVLSGPGVLVAGPDGGREESAPDPLRPVSSRILCTILSLSYRGAGLSVEISAPIVGGGRSDGGEEHLVSETKTSEVAAYTISIENDGNKALGPVYVQDLFPLGSAYIEASVRPSELTDNYANWTLLNIGIGDVVDIDLELDVTECHTSELVNRVKVWGGINNGDDWVYASNFSALEVKWLTCCPEGPIEVETRAETNGTVVRYEIEINNQEDAMSVATVADYLPAGMELVESSVPFASYEDVVWNLVEIPASGTAEIEFSALAPGAGRFTNSVEVDPRSVDGSVVQLVSATCVIDVGTASDECGTVSCDAWQPPDWEFEHYGYGSDETTCEDLTCTSCGGTDSWLAQ